MSQPKTSVHQYQTSHRDAGSQHAFDWCWPNYLFHRNGYVIDQYSNLIWWWCITLVSIDILAVISTAHNIDRHHYCIMYLQTRPRIPHLRGISNFNSSLIIHQWSLLSEVNSETGLNLFDATFANHSYGNETMHRRIGTQKIFGNYVQCTNTMLNTMHGSVGKTDCLHNYPIWKKFQYIIFSDNFLFLVSSWTLSDKEQTDEPSEWDQQSNLLCEPSCAIISL